MLAGLGWIIARTEVPGINNSMGAGEGFGNIEPGDIRFVRLAKQVAGTIGKQIADWISGMTSALHH